MADLTQSLPHNHGAVPALRARITAVLSLITQAYATTRERMARESRF